MVLTHSLSLLYPTVLYNDSRFPFPLGAFYVTIHWVTLYPFSSCCCCCWCMRQFHLFHFVILYLKWIHSRRLLSRKLLLIVCVCVWCKEMLETQRKRVNEVRATKWRVGVHIMHSFNMQPKGELGKCLFCNSTSIQETLQPTQQLQLPLFSFI